MDFQVDISKLKFYYMEGEGSNVSNKIGSDVKKAMLTVRQYLKNTYNIEAEPVIKTILISICFLRPYFAIFFIDQ